MRNLLLSSRTELSTLSRSDVEGPDGLTIVPWVRGRSVVSAFTCPDTLAACHLNRAVVGPGAVATTAQSVSTVRVHADCRGDSWSRR